MEHDVGLQHIEVSCASGLNASVQKRLFSQLIQFRKVYYVHRQCRIIAGRHIYADYPNITSISAARLSK